MIYWTFPMGLFSRECHWISLVISQQWLMARFTVNEPDHVAWTYVNQVLWRHMTSPIEPMCYLFLGYDSREINSTSYSQYVQWIPNESSSTFFGLKTTLVSMMASFDTLTHRGRNNMTAISQTTLSIASPWMKMLEFRFEYHWSLFIRVRLTIFQHWFR